MLYFSSYQPSSSMLSLACLMLQQLHFISIIIGKNTSNVSCVTEDSDCRFHGQQKKTNEWVLNKAGVKRELLDIVKARKLAYYGHTMKKQGSCLGKEIMQRKMPDACRQGNPHTAWMDNIMTWTGLLLEESIRMTGKR